MIAIPAGQAALGNLDAHAFACTGMREDRPMTGFRSA